LFEATRKELRELLFGAQPHIAEWGVWHTEAYVRFGQSQFALQRFRALEVELEPRIRDRKFSDEGTALRFFAESFYYFAWRCGKVMRPRSARHWLGHSKISMTLDIYSQVLPTMGRGAADRLGALLHG